MKITLVGPLYPYRGGIAHFMETMARGLGARGHAVDAVTFARQYPSLLFPGKTQYEEGPPPPDVPPAPRLLDPINPISWLRTAAHVANERPDVLLYKFWMPFFGPAFGTVTRLARRQGIRSLVVVDNAIPHERRPGDLTLARYFLRACDGLVVMSESVERDLATLGVEAPVRRVRHPIYNLFGEGVAKAEARAALGLPNEAPVLLFFGFIRRYKGLHVLLEAMPKVLERLPEARLVVAGEFYDDATPYRDFIRNHDLASRVLLHSDYIPTEDVAHYFSAADVVVQPYVSATQSGVAQVAFNFDKPLVVTDVGGLAEVVPHERAGLVVPPEDPAALAEALVRYFEASMADRLADGVRAEKAKYSWDHLYDALEDLA